MNRPSSGLAIDGAAPAVPEGPPDWPPADAEVADVLQQAYQSGDWGRYEGAFTSRLSRRIAEHWGVEHVQLCCSGTLAVELALRGLGVGAGDEVVLAAYDFPGNFRAVEAVGARPVLIDLDPDTWSLDISRLPESVGPDTRAVIASHLHGTLADMARLRPLAHELGLKVVEDACQVPGATLDGRPAGCWGDVGVLSFGGSKLLTAGRGGAVLTGDPLMAQRMRVASERGNQLYPLSELQAAVLLPQLDKLPARHVTRLRHARQIVQRLKGGRVLRPAPWPRPGCEPAFYKVGFWLAAPSGECRDEVRLALQAEGLAVDSGFRGFVQRSSRRCRAVGTLQHAHRAAQHTLLLHHPVLLAPPHMMAQVLEAFLKVDRQFVTSR